jgi:hypothetical protein
LGLAVPKLIKSTQHLQFYAHLELKPGAFFDRETFGTDKLVVGIDKATLAHVLRQAPLSAKARDQLVELETGAVDYMPGLSSNEKKERLSRMSYPGFQGMSLAKGSIPHMGFTPKGCEDTGGHRHRTNRLCRARHRRRAALPHVFQFEPHVTIGNYRGAHSQG